MKSLLQTAKWGEFKASQGWRNYLIDDILILEKKLPLGFSFLYSPEAAGVALEKWQNILENIKKIAENKQTIFYRLEIHDEKQSENGQKMIEKLKPAGFVKAFEEVQPEWRQIIDISPNLEEILAQMKPKGRYNIKVAQKHGLEVANCPIDRLNEGIEIFFKLMIKTAREQKFTIRPKNYYHDLVKMLYDNDFGKLLIARLKGMPVAAIIISIYEDTASYLYGASAREHKNLMAPYLLHWEAIKIAKEKGGRFYDLLAIAPSGKEINHKYENLTRFKEQFGGRKVQIIGSWDLVFKPFGYKMFKIAERFRRR